MMFIRNGAIMISTFDSANIELCEEANEDNIFILGLRAEDIDRRNYTGEKFYWLKERNLVM